MLRLKRISQVAPDLAGERYPGERGAEVRCSSRHMQIVIPFAQIVNDAPYTDKAGVIVQFSRVQYMGGEIRVKNAAKVPAGTAKDVRITISLRDAAKTYRSKETGQAGAFVSKECQFETLDSATPAK